MRPTTDDDNVLLEAMDDDGNVTETSIADVYRKRGEARPDDKAQRLYEERLGKAVDGQGNYLED